MSHALIEQLKDALTERNLADTKNALESISVGITEKDTSLIQEITAPPVITDLHKQIGECFGVPQRAMMLKNRVSTTQRRALLFVKAMQNGLSKVKEEE